ncbi:hypothetical protein BJY01DRAFT_233934 [Aspergillus pseudoustus]|uniref:Uncharacterized protein n=1 Tax=Aspergillus pseudoustus TaxID=1810923 RepID=A0ABR4K870_9EURO
MSNQREKPWTEEEKYALLTEILKKARVPSHTLVKMIKDMNIIPSWADIPLPSGTDGPPLPYAGFISTLQSLSELGLNRLYPGRSLNSCQSAFQTMCQELPPPIHPGPSSVPPSRLGYPPPPPIGPIDPGSNVRKRTLFPAEKRILAPAPREIQPRIPASTASYSSESGAPAILSPGIGGVTTRGEPPRKRGRPSKAESERRKLAAEARGETYPPLRRAGSHRVKIPSTPTSPSGIELGGPAYPSQTSSRPPPSNVSPEARYVPPPLRAMAMIGPSDEERLRDLPGRELGPTLRELPRPTDVRQTLPSPQALQLGHRDTIPRMEPSDRPYEALPSDRNPFTDSSRRSIVHPSPRHPDEPPTPDLPVPLTTTAEK